MFDFKEVLDSRDIQNVLSKISLRDFFKVLNEYVAIGLEVGKIYKVNEMHNIIQNNLKCGLLTLFVENNNFDYSKIEDMFNVRLWNIDLCVKYKDISVYETIGDYQSIQFRKRKNATIVNNNVKVEKLPSFEMKAYKDNLGMDVSLLDYIRFIIEDVKNNMIEKYEKENESFRNSILDNEERIKELKKINFGMETITKTEWEKIHKDFKSVINGQKYIMRLTESGTCLIPILVK